MLQLQKLQVTVLKSISENKLMAQREMSVGNGSSTNITFLQTLQDDVGFSVPPIIYPLSFWNLVVLDVVVLIGDFQVPIVDMVVDPTPKSFLKASPEVQSEVVPKKMSEISPEKSPEISPKKLCVNQNFLFLLSVPLQFS